MLVNSLTAIYQLSVQFSLLSAASGYIILFKSLLYFKQYSFQCRYCKDVVLKRHQTRTSLYFRLWIRKFVSQLWEKLLVAVFEVTHPFTGWINMEMMWNSLCSIVYQLSISDSVFHITLTPNKQMFYPWVDDGPDYCICLWRRRHKHGFSESCYHIKTKHWTSFTFTVI